jgi:hypothetical protein
LVGWEQKGGCEKERLREVRKVRKVQVWWDLFSDAEMRRLIVEKGELLKRREQTIEWCWMGSSRRGLGAKGWMRWTNI